MTMRGVIWSAGILTLLAMAGAQALAAGPADAERKVWKQLADQGDELFVENQPLEKVLSNLAKKSHLTIEVDWKSLEAKGIGKDTAVSVQFRPVPLKQLLSKFVAEVGGDKANMAFRVGNGKVYVATRDRLNELLPPYEAVYDLRGMLGPLVRAAATTQPSQVDPARIVQGLMVQPDAQPVAESEPRIPDDLIKEILTEIQQKVEPGSWRDAGGTIGEIRTIDRALVVKQTSENQEEVRCLLNGAQPIQIALEVRFITAEAAELKTLGVEGVLGKDESTRIDLYGELKSRDAAVLDAALCENVLEHARQSRTATVSAPTSLKIINGEAGIAGTLASRKYIASYVGRVGADGQTEYVPQTAILPLGTTERIEAIVSAGRTHVVLEVKPTTQSLVEMKTAPAPGVPAEKKLTVEVPVVQIVPLPESVPSTSPKSPAAVVQVRNVIKPVDLRAWVPDGRTLLIVQRPVTLKPVPPATQPMEGCLLVLVRPNILMPGDELPAATAPRK